MRSTLKAHVVLLSIAIVAAPSLTRAAGFELADQSVVAAGTGGAGVARQGDPGAVWYNPAALADGAGWRAGVSLFLAMPRLTASSTDMTFAPGAKPTDTQLGVSTPFAAQLGWSRGRWAFGLYAGTSHGSSIAWPDGWWGRYDAQATSVRVIRAAPSAAVRLGPVRLGVTVNIDYGAMEIQRALTFVDTDGKSSMRLSGVSAGAGASIFWQALPQLALGLTYQSRTVMKLDGEANFTVPESFASRAPDQKISSSLTLPDRFALGAAWSRRKLTVYGDVTLSLWSVRDVLKIDFSDPATTDVEIPQRWKEGFSLRLGVEGQVHARVTLRGGAYYDHQAAPSETLAPSSPDMARVGLSLGGSVQLHRTLAADLSYAVAILLPRDSTSPDAIPAAYSGHAHILGIAFRAAQPPAPPAPPPTQATTRVAPTLARR
jgi:long-chain fatty acid transport protein